MKNLLICGFGEAWHRESLVTLNEKYGTNRTILISTLDHDLESEEYIYHDLQKFAYCEYEVDNSIEPLDADIVERFAYVQTIYMSMLDRLEIKSGKGVGYHDRLHYYYDDLRTMNHFLKVYEINICIIDYIPHLGFDYLLYELCKANDIPVVMQCYSLTIPYKTVSRYFLKDIQNPLDRFSELYKEEKNKLLGREDIEISKRAQNYIDYYDRDKDEIKSIVTTSVFVKQLPKPIKYAKSFARMLANNDRRLVPAIKLRISEFFRLKQIGNYISNVCKSPTDGEVFIYFPLHYQPECTSLPMAYSYSDQLLVIQLISSLLPQHVSLYVKPHPNPSILADKIFFEKINKYDNVYLLPSRENSYDLIEKAIATVSLTGTAIWESIIRKKPVLMFGYYFLQYAPGVYHVQDEDDCRQAINQIVSSNSEIDMRDVKIFLKVLDDYLYEGYLDEEYRVICDIAESRNVENMTKGYIDFIEKNWG